MRVSDRAGNHRLHDRPNGAVVHRRRNARRWPIFVFGVLAVIAVSTLLGWVLTRMRVLPGSVIVWGSSPGAATAMIVMAEDFGADARLVAFMQYLRVALVAAVASIVARFCGLNPRRARRCLVSEHLVAVAGGNAGIGNARAVDRA